MKSAVCLILLLPLVQAQPTPKADACSPPPGAVPPTLPAKLLEGQGGVHFKITTRSAEAQAFFDQGISQMHSFWVREAERSFLQAAALDPEAPMPHFGIAMVAAGDFRPGFQLDLVNGVNPRKPEPRKEPPAGGEARAIAAAKKALELSQRKGRATDLEKMYIAAAFARRDVTAPDPNIGYVAALRKLIAKYPKEVEARAYLALQIMSGFEMPSKTPRAGTMEAVELLRALLRDAPDHAGVHHYVIHGFEGSTFAKEAWPSCKRYGELANNIPHGLHMPGHIYAQTGRWRDASEAFAAAAHNEIYWMGQDSLAGNGHHGHNVHFLAMALSFQNEFAEAERAARSLLEYKETPREAKQTDN
jgi:tetratricopeptide (TPR) repeat protein